MPRLNRLFAAAALSTLAALLPVTAFASDLTTYVVGAEYDFGHSCTVGTTVGTTASFAGYGRAPAGGRINAFFNTTICHTEMAILADGSFLLATRQRTLVGQYSGGSLTPNGLPTPLGSTLCTQSFSVKASLTGLPTPVRTGVTNILPGSYASGTLTHFGVVNLAGGCDVKAATITGTATLYY